MLYEGVHHRSNVIILSTISLIHQTVIFLFMNMKKIFLHSKRIAARRFVTILMCLPIWAGQLSAQNAYAVFDESQSTLTFKYDVGGGIQLNKDKTIPAWAKYKRKIRKVVFDPSFANARPTSCYYWFNEFYELESIVGIENLNTDEVINMAHMFSLCPKLAELDVSKFNTSKVKSMRHMFQSCSNVPRLDVSGFDTRNVTDMSYMFNDCVSITSLDVSKFDTHNVIDMSGMFSACLGITSLELSNFNTQNVTDMNNMFSNSKNIVTLDLSGFDTRNVSDMDGMFFFCKALKTIYATDSFVVTALKKVDEMFYGCESLEGAIKFDPNKINSWYANCTDGYFTCPTQSGIDDVSVAKSHKTVFYDLQGRRLSKPQSGVNIVKSVNGTSKVILRVR